MDNNHFCTFLDGKVITSSAIVADAIANQIPDIKVYLTAGPTRETADCLGRGLVETFDTVRSFRLFPVRSKEGTTYFARPIF